MSNNHKKLSMHLKLDNLKLHNSKPDFFFYSENTSYRKQAVLLLVSLTNVNRLNYYKLTNYILNWKYCYNWSCSFKNSYVWNYFGLQKRITFFSRVHVSHPAKFVYLHLLCSHLEHGINEHRMQVKSVKSPFVLLMK